VCESEKVDEVFGLGLSTQSREDAENRKEIEVSMIL
jgi:hypothetical protein